MPYINIIPKVLSLSTRFHCSVAFTPDCDSSHNISSIAPNYSLCEAAAIASLDLFKLCGDLGTNSLSTVTNTNNRLFPLLSIKGIFGSVQVLI